MQSAIENQLGLKNVKILRGNSLDSDHGKLFVKYGDEDLVRGEFESLKAIQETDTIFCPKAFGVVEKEGSHALITSFIEFEHGKDWAKAGNLLARMHMKNAENVADGEKGRQFVGGGSHRIRRMTMPMSESESEDSEPENEEENENFCTKKFGFKVPTCCGRLPQENAWLDSWADFFIRNRLKPQIDRLIETHGDRALLDVADALYRKAEQLLRSREKVLPGLVHGDLWGGNWSMTTISGESVPVIFDPSASFSDPEFEFGIMHMFGGWTREFQTEYDKIVGGASSGKAERIALYELYHNLNHWNHFGGSYKHGSMALIRSIVV